jgi:hypothetical protein
LSAKGQAGFVKSRNLKLSGWALGVLANLFDLAKLDFFLNNPKSGSTPKVINIMLMVEGTSFDTQFAAGVIASNDLLRE